MQRHDHILLLDHDPERRALSERVLLDAGFRVTAFAEGLSALRIATRARFALMLAAIDLPGTLDGTTTLGYLRAGQAGLKALFIVPAPLVWEPDGGPDEFIAAPFHERDLLGCVFELLQRDTVGGHTRAC